MGADLVNSIGMEPTGLLPDPRLAAGAVREWIDRWKEKRGGPKPVRIRALADFCEALADLLQAGIQILEALKMLEQASADRVMEKNIAFLRREVAAGTPLSEAAERARVFPPIVAASIRAGEESGEIIPVLKSLAESFTRRAEFVGEVRRLLAYPVMIVTILLAVAMVYVAFVIPRLEQVFPGGYRLPPLTRLIIAASRNAKWIIPLVPFAAAGAVALAAFGVRVKPLGRAVLALPLVGPVINHTIGSRFFRSMGLLLKSGIQMDRAVMVAARASGRIMSREGELIRAAMHRGATVIEAMRSPLFPPMVHQLLAIGESTGEMHRYMARLGEIFERMTQRDLRRITEFLGPAMLIGVAAMILVVFFAFVLPIYQNMTTMIAY